MSLLQRLRLDHAPSVQPLYTRRTPPGPLAAPLATGDRLDLDTYFNAFDERVWRRHATVGRLSLALALTGRALVQLRRHAGTTTLLAEAITEDAVQSRSLLLPVPDPPHPRAAGRLSLEITALEDGVTLQSGAWLTDAAPRDAGLAIVICTCNRDRPLEALLRTLAADLEAAAAVDALIVVNNGAPGLAARLDPALNPSLHIVEQLNIGGAGGFSRGLLEARAIRGITHAVLIDDDVALEPEAILRTSRFIRHAHADTVLGGHMLDLFRPTILYEAGARIDPARLGLIPQRLQSKLDTSADLDALLEPTPVHYYGWWFMALPLALLDRHGWPMPCFIRGDDVEFGLRLHDAGVPSTTMLGVGIWHEPFTAKLGSWHLYYECRNMLALAAWRLNLPRARLIRVVAGWITADLLTFRYQRAALLLRAIEDFLSGPTILDRDPRTLHASLAETRAPFPVGRIAHERVLPERTPPVGPRHLPAFAAGVARAAFSELLRPDRAPGRTLRIAPRDHLWFRVRGADAIAVAEPWEVEQPLYLRSRANARFLSRIALRLVLRLWREWPALGLAWCERLPIMTTEAAWLSYLATHAQSAPDGAEENRRCPSTTPATVAASAVPPATSSAANSPLVHAPP